MGIPAVCAARTTRATLSEPPMLPGLIRTAATDRKSTRLNSSHSQISYAVFCLKKKKGVDLLFRPSVDEMYLADRSTFVEETSLATTLEGKARPSHFRGVCTVVAKVLDTLATDSAVFGEKDFQQLAIVRRMVRDLNLKVDIVGVPTVREEDGLASSSRNQYLSGEERKQATV